MCKAGARVGQLKNHPGPSLPPTFSEFSGPRPINGPSPSPLVCPSPSLSLTRLPPSSSSPGLHIPSTPPIYPPLHSPPIQSKHRSTMHASVLRSAAVARTTMIQFLGKRAVPTCASPLHPHSLPHPTFISRDYLPPLQHIDATNMAMFVLEV